ncbi:MAG: cytochrome c biogenesis protein CcdA [Rhodospirillales bacterium]
MAEIDGVTLSAVAVMALAGAIVGIAPGSYPLAAVAVGFAAGENAHGATASRTRGLRLSLGYALGIAVVDAAVGALFGLAGFMVLGVLAVAMVYVYFGLSMLLTIAALALLRVIHLRFRLLYAAARPVKKFRDSFGLGLLFGLTTCPACTPLILPVLIAASTTGDVLMGGVLLLAFGLGRGVPILAAGTATGVLARMTELMHIAVWFDRTVGVLLFAAALWFAYQGAIYAGWLAPAAGQ